jgi:hypothetical protein
MAVERDPPFGRVVQARQQRGERRLARARGADDGDGLAGVDGQVDAQQRGAVAALVAEHDVLEADLSSHVGDHVGVGPIGDDGLGVEHLVHADGRRLGFAREGHDPAEDLEREREHEQVRDERDEAAEREAARADCEHACEEHRGEREVGDDAEHPHELGVQLDAVDLRVVEPTALGVVAVVRLAPAAERLEHADAARTLFDRGREVAGLVLDAANDLVVPALEAAAEDEHGHCGDEGEQRQPHVQGHQHGEDRGDLHDDQDEEDRAEADEASDDREVGLGARQQLARLPLVVEPDVEALELRVEVVAQVGLEVDRDPAEQESATESEQDLQHRQAACDRRPADEPGAVTLAERTVDDRLHDERHGHLRARGDDRRHDDERHVRDVRPKIWPGPPERAVAPGPPNHHPSMLDTTSARPTLSANIGAMIRTARQR